MRLQQACNICTAQHDAGGLCCAGTPRHIHLNGAVNGSQILLPVYYSPLLIPIGPALIAEHQCPLNFLVQSMAAWPHSWPWLCCRLLAISLHTCTYECQFVWQSSFSCVMQELQGPLQLCGAADGPWASISVPGHDLGC